MKRLCRAAREYPGAIALSTIEVAAANHAGLERRDRLMAGYGDLIDECLNDEGKRTHLPSTLAQAKRSGATPGRIRAVIWWVTVAWECMAIGYTS